MVLPAFAMPPPDAITTVPAAMSTLAHIRYANSFLRRKRKIDTSALPSSTNVAGIVSSSDMTRG